MSEPEIRFIITKMYTHHISLIFNFSTSNCNLHVQNVHAPICLGALVKEAQAAIRTLTSEKRAFAIVKAIIVHQRSSPTLYNKEQDSVKNNTLKK